MLLFTKFIINNTDLHLLSQQRIADQVRVIYRNNRVPASEREKNLGRNITKST